MKPISSMPTKMFADIPAIIGAVSLNSDVATGP
jgi:hypothetical protein